MLVMPSPKKKPPAEKKKPARNGANLNVWIDSEVRDALDAFVAQHEPTTTITAVVELAIKQYLARVRPKPPIAETD